jgi:alpha-ketoglutarate-dependent taurine dioxygenase
MQINLEIEPFTAALGAFIHVSAEAAASPAYAGRILDALNRYHVLVFPQVNMSDAQFLELTANLGEQHDNTVTDDGTEVSRKGIFRIALDKNDKTQRDFILGNDHWHMDGMSYTTPVKATLLKCQSAPLEGGDTGFASLHAAYDALSETTRQRLQGLKVGHCMSAVMRKVYDHPAAEDFARWDAIFPRLEHPLVWAQNTGKSSLLIGSTANDIAGLPEAESHALLDELLDWCTQDRFTYRHHWHNGDLVIFNNPALLHRSYPYTDTAGRVMHRTTLKGKEAISSIAREAQSTLY